MLPRASSCVFKADQIVLQQYLAVHAFYGKLTNPMMCLPIDALVDTITKASDGELGDILVLRSGAHRETELFNQIFPSGVPAGANLMSALIRRIRSGEVNLAPSEKSGWYQYQVYALQTMLLPRKVQESEKLLLTAEYKKRLIKAFKALITKRRETHSRQLAESTAKSIDPLGRGEVRPRLRVEPNLTFYLRTARAYGFLQNFLLATVGAERLAAMSGLRKGGRREMKLGDELEAIKLRFYGFYLVGCEDIGMRPKFLKDEPVDWDAARQTALAWLESFSEDPDLACDTRVSVPIYIDPISQKTRLWGTLGVRLAHLETSYARYPKVRPKDRSDDWQDVKSYQIGGARFVIPVDAFAEFEIDGLDALTREEFRKTCDQYKTKEKIIEALSAR